MRFGRILALLGSIAQIWLAASDVHLNPYDASPDPSLFGSDTNLALYHSAIAAMKRSVPDPAVVVLAGDFFAHAFAGLASKNAASPDDAGLAAMRRIESDFARAYPHAQFAIALGNNDAPCGDYRSAYGSAYLKAVARMWAPLVDRSGSAPGFLDTFVRGGYYTIALRAGATRMIVLDTVAFSRQYGGNCGGAANGAAASQLEWLRAQLARTPPGGRNVALMHVPPGYDAFSTLATHGLVSPRFLGPDGGALSSLLALPRSRIAFAIAAHTHHFDVRLVGGVPLIVLGSISPVFHNDPAFYALHVDDGGLQDVDEYAFDEAEGAWEAPHTFDRAWKAARIDTASLATVHAGLERDRAMRERWDAQTEGWPTDPDGVWSQWGANWRIPWCAQVFLGDGFEKCAGIERRTRYGFAAVALLALALASAAFAAGVLLFRLWRSGVILSLFKD